MRKVRVVEDQFLIGTELIDRSATFFALEELDDLAVGSSDNWSFGRSRNIYSIVRSAFRPRITVGVEQLVRPHSGDWNDQIYPADKVCGFGSWRWGFSRW
jgi:hypothetical protein